MTLSEIRRRVAPNLSTSLRRLRSAAVDVDIARDLLDFGGAFFEIQLYVAVDIFHRNVAVLAGDLDFSVRP